MTFSSKDLYRELRTGLGPLMKANGFRPTKGGRLGWMRPHGQTITHLWFQADKWGWNETWGSTFTVEFISSAEPTQGWNPLSSSERLGYLLEGFGDLDEIRKINNSIIEALPGTKQNLVVMGYADGTSFIAEGYRPDPEPAIYGRDLWLNYYSVADVATWSAYFQEKLLYFASLFEEGIRSEVSQARLRSEELMMRFHAEKDTNAKMAILMKYAAREKEPFFRSRAERLLEEIQHLIASR